MKDLTEHFVAGGLVYEGDMLKVHRDTVRLPDGSQGSREYVKHPGAVAIVALDEQGRLLLERQYRYPARREFIEIPAGKVDPGEPHLETAKRELLEETGYVAGEWTRLGAIHNSIGYSDEVIELWRARRLTLKERRLDPGEFLETFLLPFDEALAMVRDGRISDAKTIAGILWLKTFAPG